MSGPLDGIRVIEMAGIGPGPMCAMLLADLGADVVRIDRPVQVDLGVPRRGRVYDVLRRGRRSLAVDLKDPDGVATVLALVEEADAIIEGFRPGVMERLGLGPDECLARNPALVFGRMTGWGQEGPLATAAGHDLNYIALTGALDAIGPTGGDPVPPLNLVGDYGGGALFLAFGVCAALLEARSSGQGQVVDAAMVDGAATLMTSVFGLFAAGDWQLERGTNTLDSGSYFYGPYRCSDGRYISIAPIEPKFHAELLERLGLDPVEFDEQRNRDHWPERKARLAELFATKTRDEWTAELEGTDVCFAPVLDLGEAPEHPHAKAREAFVEVDGVVQPAPAPRFSRTPGRVHGPVPEPGQHSREVLADWGLDEATIDRLVESGTIVVADAP
ncbi:MAG: CaiB/BaiF CoA-transferase family protein [Actinomycetota bacterium]